MKKKPFSFYIGDVTERLFEHIITRLPRRFFSMRRISSLNVMTGVNLYTNDGTRYMSIGELDLMVLDKKNRIISVFEVKASIGQIKKAVKQMRSTKRILHGDDPVYTDGSPFGKKGKIPIPFTLHPDCHYYTVHLMRNSQTHAKKISWSFFIQHLGGMK